MFGGKNVNDRIHIKMLGQVFRLSLSSNTTTKWVLSGAPNLYSELLLHEYHTYTT